MRFMVSGRCHKTPAAGASILSSAGDPALINKEGSKVKDAQTRIRQAISGINDQTFEIARIAEKHYGHHELAGKVELLEKLAQDICEEAMEWADDVETSEDTIRFNNIWLDGQRV